ncbi:hypothetical protein [Lignipirellula cremea]|uniref:Uncharacterized protein n=1 Tax=Lignipirellula cremea TaxID=2528010 RepID=A0A518DU80_9BACT|nr:hypothetical protein [Lignipirellula cremea]QDU95388.1 hypothetical protein Pla8534_32030 [Lignipirellula cremea]
MSTQERNSAGASIAPRPRPTSVEEMNPAADLMEYCQIYAREKPEVVAFACFGIGFILGWKLKPW